MLHVVSCYFMGCFYFKRRICQNLVWGCFFLWGVVKLPDMVAWWFWQMVIDERKPIFSQRVLCGSKTAFGAPLRLRCKIANMPFVPFLVCLGMVVQLSWYHRWYLLYTLIIYARARVALWKRQNKSEFDFVELQESPKFAVTLLVDFLIIHSRYGQQS